MKILCLYGNECALELFQKAFLYDQYWLEMRKKTMAKGSCHPANFTSVRYAA